MEIVQPPGSDGAVVSDAPGHRTPTPARNNLDGRRFLRDDPLGARRTEEFRIDVGILRLAERYGGTGLVHDVRLHHHGVKSSSTH